MRRIDATYPLALLLLCAVSASAGAATTAWRTEIAGGDVEGFGSTSAFGEIQPTADGFWLVGNSSATGWVARHGRDGSRIGLQRFSTRIGYASAESRGALVMRHGPGDYGFVETIDECVVERGALGAPRSLLSLDAGAPNGGDGVIEAGAIEGLDIRSTDLYRVQRDCRREALPAIGRDAIVDLRNDPAADAAYVLASDADGSNVEVLRIDRDRVRWRLPLAGVAAGEGQLQLGEADVAGVGLLWFDFRVPGFQCRFSRVTSDGRLAWERSFDITTTGLIAWRPAPLLAHFRQGVVTRFEAIDRDTGETTFSETNPVALRGLQRLPSSRNDAGWRIAGYLGDSGPGAMLALDPVGKISVRWRANDGSYRLRAELADGSLVVSRGRDFFLTDWSIVAPDETQGSGRLLPDAGRAPLVRAPQLIVAGPDGAALAGYHEEARAYIARVEADGRFAWTAELPRTGVSGGVRVVAAAMDNTRACALAEGSSFNRLRCFDAHTGEPSFDADLGDRSSNWRIGAFADGIHVLDAEVTNSQAGRREVPRLRVFGPSGEVRLRRALPMEQPYDRLSELGPLGEVLSASSTALRAIAPDGTLRWTISLRNASSARVASDGGALLVEVVFLDGNTQTTLRRIAVDSSERWRRTFGSVIVAPLGSDWLLRDGGRLWRIADADGIERWAVPRPASSSLRTTSDDGSGFVDSAAWYDGNSGARVGTLVDAPDVAVPSILRFARDGRLLRLVSQLDAGTSSLTLERYERDPIAGPRARAAASGFWHAPSVPGQGIALAVDRRNGAVDGRWLTFRGARETRIDEQRWYRLTGRAALDGDAIALTIEAPQPSGFDGGDVVWRAVGSARWRMRDCSRVELDYRLDDGDLSRSGLLVLARREHVDDCEARHGPESPVDVDVWSADGDPDRALLVALRRDGAVFAYWPTFVPSGADAGRPHWLTLEGEGQALRIERTLAGTFATGATRNTLTIGSATMQRSGCDRIAIDYRFEAGEVAAPFDEREGRLVLQRRGRCPR